MVGERVPSGAGYPRPWVGSGLLAKAMANGTGVDGSWGGRLRDRDAGGVWRPSGGAVLYQCEERED